MIVGAWDADKPPLTLRLLRGVEPVRHVLRLFAYPIITFKLPHPLQIHNPIVNTHTLCPVRHGIYSARPYELGAATGPEKKGDEQA